MEDSHRTIEMLDLGCKQAYELGWQIMKLLLPMSQYPFTQITKAFQYEDKILFFGRSAEKEEVWVYEALKTRNKVRPLQKCSDTGT